MICLISGGGSALLTAPADGITLADKQAINQALLQERRGHRRDELRAQAPVGAEGRAAGGTCAPARVVTLLISDVPGDEPSVIASGPTVPDPSTCADALAIVERYGIAVRRPSSKAWAQGRLETPKPGDAVFAGHEVKLDRHAASLAGGGGRGGARGGHRPRTS